MTSPNPARDEAVRAIVAKYLWNLDDVDALCRELASAPAPASGVDAVARLVHAVIDYAAVPMGHDSTAASKAVDDAKAAILASPPAEALPSQTSGAGSASDRTAEDVLRDLAMSLGVGGYNDIGDAPFDPEKFDRKIRDGIDILQAPLVEAWRRYLKLRSIGAAPNGTLHLQKGLVMVATNLDRWLDEYIATGLPPARSHAVELKGFGSSPEEAVADAVASDRPFQRTLAKPASEPAGGGVRENFASCGQWADETFGPATPLRRLERAGEELTEAMSAPADKLLEEMADTVICIAAAAHSAGGDLQAAIDAKMAINRKRKWSVRGDGTGYHIPAALSSPASSSPAEAQDGVEAVKELLAGLSAFSHMMDCHVGIGYFDGTEITKEFDHLVRPSMERLKKVLLSSAPAQEDGA